MFIQIGEKYAINIHRIESVYFGKDYVCIYMAAPDGDEQSHFRFMGVERELFLKWWCEKAEVYRIT